MDGSLPALPPDTVLASLGRSATRYPGSRWLDVLALRASQGAADAEELLRRVRDGQSEGLDRRDLAWFGYLAAADQSSALDDVVAILDHALAPPDPPGVGSRLWSLYLQALHLAGRPDPARSLGEDQLALVDPYCRWGVETDSSNPFLHRDSASMPTWLAALSRPFTETGAAPLALTEEDSAPFDRLTTTGAAPVDGDLVSVIMPVFNPDQSLVTAVRSVLAQTWRAVELLLCDDGSMTGRAFIDEAAALDPRVRVLRSAHNAGAYGAQNRGLASARGRYVSIHGADDFSHPERIARHVAALQKHNAVATLSQSVRASAQLELTVLGRSPRRVNLSSLLFERDVVLPALGGFDSVRRAGDTEFIRRIEAQFSPASVVTLDDPLAVIQTTPDSLSRNDFGMLRRSPAREAYRVGFEGWHARIAAGAASAALQPPMRAPFPAPAHISGVQQSLPETVDLVFLGNPMANAPIELGRIVQACTGAGLRVAVVEFLSTDDVRYPPRTAGVELATAVADGAVRLVLPGETVTARAGVLLDAETALLMPRERLLEVQVEQLYLAAHRLECAAASRVRTLAAASGAPHVHWLPANDSVAAALHAADPGSSVLAPMQWHLPALPPGPLPEPPRRSRPPVVGMMTPRGVPRSVRQDWVGEVVPRSAGIQLHRFGRGPAAVARRPVAVVEGISRDEFLDQVDFLLAPPLPRRQLTELIVTAWARGVVVLAEEAMSASLGDAALYPCGEPDALITRLQDEPSDYRRTQQRAADWVRDHATADSLAGAVTALLPAAGR